MEKTGVCVETCSNRMTSARMKPVVNEDEVQAKSHYKAFLDGSIDEAMLAKAREELNESEENVQMGMEKLKELIQKNNLPFIDDEEMLIRFLRVKKFRIKDSFNCMKGFLEAIMWMRDTYGTLEAPAIKEVFETNCAGFLPFRDSNGAGIAFYRRHVRKALGLDFLNVLKMFIFLGFYAMEQPASQINGIKVIFDVQNSTLRDVSDLMEGCRILFPLLKGLPVRINRVDFINCSPFSHILYRILKPIMPSKIRNRVSLHRDDLEPFHEFYDPAILPQEFGGTLGAISNNHWFETLDETFDKLYYYERIICGSKNQL